MTNTEIFEMLKEMFPDVEQGHTPDSWWFLKTDRGREFCLTVSPFGVAHLCGFNNAGPNTNRYPEVELNKESILKAVKWAMEREHKKAISARKSADKRVNRTKKALSELNEIKV